RPRPTLASRCNSDSRLFCGCSSSSPWALRISAWAGIGRSSNFGMRGARGGGRSAAGGVEVFARRGPVRFGAGGLLVREQGRLLRDWADSDVAIGRGLRGCAGCLDRGGDGGERSALDIAGGTRSRSWSDRNGGFQFLGAVGEALVVGAQ